MESSLQSHLQRSRALRSVLVSGLVRVALSLRSIIPLPFSSAVSYLFPESAQAFFDAHGETFVDKTVGVRRFTELRAALPTPLALAMVYFGFDIACVVGFAAWAVCSHEGLIALLTLAAAVKARRSLKA